MVLEGDLCLTRGRRGRESGVTRWCQSGGMDQNNAAFWHRSPTQRRWGLAAAGAQGRRRHREETNSQHPSGKLLILRPRKKKGTRIREGKPLWGTARLPFLTGLPFYSDCGCFFFYTGPRSADINQGETSKLDPRASIFPPISSRRRDLSRMLELLARAR